MYRTDFKTVAEATKEIGEPRLLEMINQFLANQNYRKGYNKARNAAFKQVKSDPRFKEVLAQVTKENRKK
jgi:uncharacterized protein YbaA (DUF1428 family)